MPDEEGRFSNNNNIHDDVHVDRNTWISSSDDSGHTSILAWLRNHRGTIVNITSPLYSKVYVTNA